MGLFKKKPKTPEEAHRPTSASKKTFEIRRKRTVGGWRCSPGVDGPQSDSRFLSFNFPPLPSLSNNSRF